jgi:peptide deformylase
MPDLLDLRDKATFIASAWLSWRKKRRKNRFLKMPLLEIKKFPDKVLREKCRPVGLVTETERRLFEDMISTMRNSAGIGLAAPQVGISQRLIVADIGEGPVCLANPEVIEAKGGERMEEGCLSLPGALVNIERAGEVVVKGLNERNEAVELRLKGLLARVIQHEIDHLNGKLIFDYMPFWQKIKFKLSAGIKRK